MLFGCFWVVILKKTIAMLEIITLEYFKMETLIQNEEALNWEKKGLIWAFSSWHLKKHIWRQNTRIFQSLQRNSKCRTNNVLFVYF